MCVRPMYIIYICNICMRARINYYMMYECAYMFMNSYACGPLYINITSVMIYFESKVSSNRAAITREYGDIYHCKE